MLHFVELGLHTLHFCVNCALARGQLSLEGRELRSRADQVGTIFRVNKVGWGNDCARTFDFWHSQGQVLLPLVAHHGDCCLVILAFAQEAREVAAIVHRRPIDFHDHISGVEAGILAPTAAFDRSH